MKGIKFKHKVAFFLNSIVGSIPILFGDRCETFDFVRRRSQVSHVGVPFFKKKCRIRAN